MSHPPTYTTEAVVLRLTDYGEADRIATLLTAARGKVSALAPGARRSRRRYGAGLLPFGHGEATLRERRGRDLPILEDFYGARGFPHLSSDLARLSHASYACELCRELCPESEPEPEVLSLLLRLLSYLDGLPASGRPRVEPLRAFELRLLAAVGLGLSLSSCAACGQAAPGRGGGVSFDRARGGVLCDGCRDSVGHAGPGGPGGRADTTEWLPEEVRGALIELARGEAWLAPEGVTGEVAWPVPGPEVQQGCRQVLLGVIRHHLGRNPRAVEFIAKLNLLQL